MYNNVYIYMYRYVTYVRIYDIVYIQVYYTYESKSPHCLLRLGFKLLGSKMQRSCSEVATWGIGKIHRENAGNIWCYMGKRWENAGNTWDSWENLWGLNVVLNGNVWE